MDMLQLRSLETEIPFWFALGAIDGDVTVTPPSATFGILSATAGPWGVGDQVTIVTENASGALVVTDDLGNQITEDSSTANSITFTIPDLTTFGTQATYGPDVPGTMGNFGSRTISVSDGTDSDSVVRVINPPAGLNLEIIVAALGILDGITGIELGVDSLYGEVAFGDAVVNWTNGAVTQGLLESSVEWKLYDVSMLDWTSLVVTTIPAQTTNASVVIYLLNLMRAS